MKTKLTLLSLMIAVSLCSFMWTPAEVTRFDGMWQLKEYNYGGNKGSNLNMSGTYDSPYGKVSYTETWIKIQSDLMVSTKTKQSGSHSTSFSAALNSRANLSGVVSLVGYDL